MTDEKQHGDAGTTLEELKAIVAAFVAERDWERFHSPKNLSMGLAIEAGELMEHFLWQECGDSFECLDNEEGREAVADELADVFTYLLNLSMVLGIDLSEAFRRKVVKNGQKYPAEQYRGRYKL